MLLFEGFKEIDARTRNSTPYDIIRTSSLLRQFFLDGGNSIAPPIAKKYDVGLNFKVLERSDSFQSDPKLYFGLYEALYPEPTFNIPNISVDLSNFLKLQCLRLGEVPVTIRDIILIVANVKGGVHLGQPKSKNIEQVEMMAMEEFVSHLMGGMVMTLQCLRDINRVVLETLYPICQGIDKKITELKK